MIHTFYRMIFRIWRRKRHALFLRRVQPTMEDRMLDVGGIPVYWTRYAPCVGRIDSLNLHLTECSAEQALQHNVRVLVGNGCALEFPDQSYDIAHSNSVIEHVGSFAQQQKFAAEIRRVGKKIWVQTPAWECPIEPHYLAPLVHYLPRSWQPFVVRWLTPRGWLDRKSWSDLKEEVLSTRLLSRREFKQLFPDCEIITERMLGFISKSYIAFRE